MSRLWKSVSSKSDVLFVDLGVHFLGDLKGLHYGGYIPYGLLCVASYAEHSGFRPAALMMDHVFPAPFTGTREELDTITRDVLEQEIRAGRPGIFALGMPYTFQFNYMLRIMRMVKEINPDILTVIGGTHTSVLYKQCLDDCPDVDVVVRGEGELTMTEILGAHQQKQKLDDISGISLRVDGKVANTGRRKFMDMSTAPMVKFDLLPNKFYAGKMINISPNRGCEFKCRFCEEQIFWGNSIRSITPDRVMAEVESIISHNYDYTMISLEDSMFDLRSAWFHELADKMSRNKKKRLGYCVTRVDSVDEDGLAAAAKMGLFAILFGVESGSEKVLGTVDKGITYEQVKKALKMSKKQGIYNGTLWVVGLPGDDQVESQKSYDFMETLYSEELTDIAAISRMVPYPGTPIFAAPKKYGVKILHYDWERWLRFTKDGCAELTDFSDQQITECYEEIFTMARTMEFNRKKALKVTDLIRY